MSTWREARAAGSFGGYASSASVAIYAIAALLIGVNWFTYVWAVNHGFVVETSLGYFITPLVNVLLGVVVLREALRPWQWAAVALATTGVAVADRRLWRRAVDRAGAGRVIRHLRAGEEESADGAAPWSHARDRSAVRACGRLSRVAELRGTGAFGHAGAVPTLFMAGAGVVTTVPLLMFATAVRLIPSRRSGFSSSSPRRSSSCSACSSTASRSPAGNSSDSPRCGWR